MRTALEEGVYGATNALPPFYHETRPPGGTPSSRRIDPEDEMKKVYIAHPLRG